MMTNRFRLYCVLGAVVMFVLASIAPPVLAQNCTATPDVITELNARGLGSYNLWDADYGELKPQEVFISGAQAIGSPNLVVAGEIRMFEEGDATLVLLEYDRNGRTIWEVFHKIDGLQSVVKMLPRGEDGYLVLGEVVKGQKSHVWIGYMDKAGKLLRSRTVKHDVSALHPHDIVALAGTMPGSSKGYLLAASVESKQVGQPFYSQIYRLNSDGRVLAERSYTPGLENRLYGLTPVGNDEFLAMGYMRGEDGRKAGWILRLDADGAISWQRQYPRGRAARLTDGVASVRNYAAVVGETRPFGEGNLGGWVMMINALNGEIAWQRFYKGALDFFGRGVLSTDDGLVTILLDGKKPVLPRGARPVETPDEHVQVITLNPRGQWFMTDEYMNADGARGYDLIEGPNGERIVLGRTKNVYHVEKETEGEDGLIETTVEMEHSNDGWIVAGTALEPYNDPCLRPYSPIE